MVEGVPGTSQGHPVTLWDGQESRIVSVSGGRVPGIPSPTADLEQS